MQYTLELPRTALEVESFLHKCCDFHGFSNCMVTINGSRLVLNYDEPVTDTKLPSTEDMKFKC